MGDVAELDHPVPTKDDFEFVTDLARFAEGGIVSEADIRRKYRLGDEVWARLGEDDELVRVIEAEKVRRIRSGATKREKAQALVVAAPDVLSSILLDNTASPRHRIDSAKALDDFAANGPAAAPASDRFIISINLSADDPGGAPTILRFDKSLAIDPNDGDPNASNHSANNPNPSDDDDPNGLIAAFLMKGGGGGEGPV